VSRTTVRNGVAAWLTTASISGVNTVYPGEPAIIPGEAFFTNAVGATSGCVAMILLPQTLREKRISLGGPTSGKKRVDYELNIRLMYRSILSPAAGSDIGIVSAAELDVIIDSIKARIRADRTAAGTVWQWGEADLTDAVGDIEYNEAGLTLWGQIVTEVTEWLDT